MSCFITSAACQTIMWYPPIDEEEMSHKQMAAQASRRDEITESIDFKSVYSNNNAETGVQKDVIMRLPHYVPLLNLIEQNFLRNIPVEIWMQRGRFDVHQYLYNQLIHLII